MADLLQVGTGTSANEAFVKTRFQLTAAELNNPEECLEFQTHQDLFLVSGGTDLLHICVILLGIRVHYLDITMRQSNQSCKIPSAVFIVDIAL